MHKSLQYLTLANYGDQIELNYKVNDCDGLVKWTEENFEYPRYNLNKDINRYGLSITSHRGELSGELDLDTLRDKVIDNELAEEDDFMIPTPVYEHPEIKKLCKIWQPYLARTHILRLDCGGFFPPHRDHVDMNFDWFRIIVPLKNINRPNMTFILDNKITNWEKGRAYFFNASKTHYLFNCDENPSYWLVLNVLTNPKTINTTIKMFNQI